MVASGVARRFVLVTGILAFTLAAAPAASAQPSLTLLDPSYVLGLKSITGVDATTMRFVNLMDSDVKVNWISYEGSEVTVTQLIPGGTWLQGTYLTHPWIIRDAYSNAPIVGFLPIGELAIANIRPFAAVVPEPSTIALLAGGMLALGALSLRRRRRVA